MRKLLLIPQWGVAPFFQSMTDGQDVVVTVSVCLSLDRWETCRSELVALDSAVEVNLTEPVVVGALGLVLSDAVEECCSAEVHCCGLLEHEVDCLEFEATATACHGFFCFLTFSL